MTKPAARQAERAEQAGRAGQVGQADPAGRVVGQAQRGGRSPGSLAAAPATSLATLLGVEATAAVEDRLVGLVESAFGRRPAPGATRVEVVSHALGSPATYGVFRVAGELVGEPAGGRAGRRGGPRGGEPAEGGGAGWSLFCKVLQSPRHWDGLRQMPPEIAEDFVASFPWRTELELWDDRVQASLPDGLRSPVLHALIELGDDRVAVWQEDVAVAPPAADLGLFDTAAQLLGRWNVRSATPDVLAVTALPPGYAMRMYAERAVPVRGLAPLADDDLWSHPWLAGHGDLRVSLARLGREIPAMLDRLDGYVQCLPHGDASPQNLLVPASGDPAELVVIDLSFRTPHPLGSDLSQLLVGLTQAGEVPATLLPEIAERILASYLGGAHAEGVTDQDAAIHDAFVTTSMLRSGFDSMLYELIGSEVPGDRHTFDERVALTRFLVAQYDER